MNKISIDQKKNLSALNLILKDYFSTRTLFYRAQRQDTLFFMGSATLTEPAIDKKINILKQLSYNPKETIAALKEIRLAGIILSVDDLNDLNTGEIKDIAKMAFNSGADIIVIGEPNPFIKKTLFDKNYYEVTDNDNTPEITYFHPLTIHTLNRYGSQIQLDEPKRAFIETAKKPGIKSLDIGAGFSNAVLHAAYSGAQDIHAWELDKNNIESLRLAIKDTEFDHRIHARHLDFKNYEVGPQDEEAYDVILISRVLHFFTPVEIAIAAEKLFRLLKPGGCLHVSAATVFMQMISGYIPQYLKKVSLNHAWPGFMDTNDMKHYIDPEYATFFPAYMTGFDLIYPAKTFKETGFEVIKNAYFSRVDSHEASIPLRIDGPYSKYRGKEAIWLILRKPTMRST